MRKRLTANLVFLGFTLQLTSLGWAGERSFEVPAFRRVPATSDERKAEQEGKVEAPESPPPAEKKEKADAQGPRAPASSQELISNETVEYLKDAGKKVERYFEPISKK